MGEHSPMYELVSPPLNLNLIKSLEKPIFRKYKRQPVCIQQNSGSGQFYITNSLISLIHKLQGKKKESERSREQLTE